MGRLEPKETFQAYNFSTLLSSVTTSGGAKKALIETVTVGKYPTTAADGDIYKFFLYLTGIETNLDLFFLKCSACGIVDIYLNDVLVQPAHDLYAASNTVASLNLTGQTFKNGENVVKYIINGKNASSTDYFARTLGVSVQ